MDAGFAPAGKGESGIAVSDPVVGSIEETETLLDPPLTAA